MTWKVKNGEWVTFEINVKISIRTCHCAPEVAASRTSPLEVAMGDRRSAQEASEALEDEKYWIGLCPKLRIQVGASHAV